MVQKKIRLTNDCITIANGTLQRLISYKWHGFRPVSFSMPYSKLYILTELRANVIKFISFDELDLLKYMYLWYRK